MQTPVPGHTLSKTDFHFKKMSSKQSSSKPQQETGPVLSEVLPKSGLVFSEKGCLTYVLCKPKIMPIKSVTLQKLEEMEKKAAELGRVDIDEHTINQVNTAAANNLEKIKQKANQAEGKTSTKSSTPTFETASDSSVTEGKEGNKASSSLSNLPTLSGRTSITEGKAIEENADVWKAE